MSITSVLNQIVSALEQATSSQSSPPSSPAATSSPMSANAFYSGAAQAPSTSSNLGSSSLDAGGNTDAIEKEVAAVIVAAIEAVVKAVEGGGTSSSSSGGNSGGGGRNSASPVSPSYTSPASPSGSGSAASPASPSPGASGVEPNYSAGSTSGVSGASPTSSSYTPADAKRDILALCQKEGKSPPSEPLLTTIANGISQGVAADFTGKNTIGDFSKVPASTVGKMLVSMAYQESDFGSYGEDAGGILQTAPVRLQQYNQAHGTNITEGQMSADPALAMKVGCWCIATVEGTLGKQAGNVPIPSNLAMQMAYYWNYNPTADHGHANELADYMSGMKQYMASLGVSGLS